MVCAEIIVSPPRPTAAEIIIGSSLPSCVEHLADRDKRRFGVQRIEDGFDQQEVHAAGDQRSDLLSIGSLHLVERDHAETGIIRIRRIRQRHSQWPDRSRDEPRTRGRVRRRDQPIPGTAAPTAR